MHWILQLTCWGMEFIIFTFQSVIIMQIEMKLICMMFLSETVLQELHVFIHVFKMTQICLCNLVDDDSVWHIKPIFKSNSIKNDVDCCNILRMYA